MYGVETKVIVQAIKRHRGRFPLDFMFQLSAQEYRSLKYESANLRGWGGRRTPPYAFTEQGVAMVSSVLNSETAIMVNIEIIRAFVRTREFASNYKSLSSKINQLETRYDTNYKVVTN